MGIPVILTAHGTISDAVEATQRGVFGFLTKPVDHDKLRDLLGKALQHSKAAEPGEWCKEIITRSPDMLHVLDQAYRIAKREVSVLVTAPAVRVKNCWPMPFIAPATVRITR